MLRRSFRTSRASLTAASLFSNPTISPSFHHHRLNLQTIMLPAATSSFSSSSPINITQTRHQATTTSSSTLIKPFQCAVCGKKFRLKTTAEVHIKNVHDRNAFIVEVSPPFSIHDPHLERQSLHQRLETSPKPNHQNQYHSSTAAVATKKKEQRARSESLNARRAVDPLGKIVMKGKGAVDFYSGKQKDCHVIEKDGVPLQCILTLTGFQLHEYHIQNQFYIIQALEKDDKSEWFVWCRGGRIGEIGEKQFNMRQYESRCVAITEFKKKFGKWTGNKWDVCLGDPLKFEEEIVSPNYLWRRRFSLFDIDYEASANRDVKNTAFMIKTPLGVMSKLQLDQAEHILDVLEEQLQDSTLLQRAVRRSINHRRFESPYHDLSLTPSQQQLRSRIRAEEDQKLTPEYFKMMFASFYSRIPHKFDVFRFKDGFDNLTLVEENREILQFLSHTIAENSNCKKPKINTKRDAEKALRNEQYSHSLTKEQLHQQRLALALERNNTKQLEWENNRLKSKVEMLRDLQYPERY